MKALRIITTCSAFGVFFAIMGTAAAYDRGGLQLIGLLAGGLSGVLIGLLFSDARGWVLDFVFGPVGDRGDN